MHNCCRIPGLTLKAGGQRLPGMGEMDRHPAWKTRRANQACDRRLCLHLAALDQKRQEVETKISNDMRIMEKALSRRDQRRRHNCSLTERETIYRDSEGCEKSENNCSSTGQNSSSQKSLLLGSMDNCSGTPGQTKGNSRECPASGQRPGSVLRRPHRLTPLYGRSPFSRRRLRRLIPRACDYRTHKSSSVLCQHFPCRQPGTYHSLGFRLDDSSTDRWITWTDLKRARLSEGEVFDPKDQGRLTPGMSLKHSLPASQFLQPLDAESKEKLLREEISRRKKLNENKKPLSWETNYGEPTPFKLLRCPVRLHPMEMTTFRGR
ncbi:uncharacterized protein LOC106011874 [Aplysia californica]|uniref:Uncharacterized protein LOC106011874 n=1 Tax=Aplysia californica TaxID=6500 RepID=A0ABM1A0P8_APLCA|nr:uncharacterized protein LOC106011874 [Aplysia californica]